MSNIGDGFGGVSLFPRYGILVVGHFLPKASKERRPPGRLMVQMLLSGRGAAMVQHQLTKRIGMKLTVALARTKLNDEVGYGYALTAVAESVAPSALMASKPYLRLTAAYEKLSDGRYKVRKNPYTQELREIDRRRDRSFRSLALAIQSAACSGFADEEDAAKPLTELFKRYGSSFTRGSNVGETGMLTKFLIDLKAGSCAMAVEKLGLALKVAQLEALEVEFLRCQCLSDGDRTETKRILSASNVRRDFEEAVRVFMVYLQAKLMEEDDEQWSKFCGEVSVLNEEMEKREALRAAARKRKKKNQDIQP